MIDRFAVAVPVVTLLFGGIGVAACSNSSTTFDFDAGDFADTGSSNPCGPSGVYGTYQISGTLDGTESICGLNLGSFDGGTLVIAQSSDPGATVTVSNSGAGYIDVAQCAATIDGCNVTTSACTGSTNKAETITLSLSVTPTALSGTSQLAYSSCQAPGMTFQGSR